MLKPLQLTAPREAGLPRAPGPCPGRRGQGFAPSSGGGPGVGGGRTAPTLERLRRGELGAHGPSRPEQQPKEGRRRRPLRSALGARRFITSQPGGPTRAGAGPAVAPGPPLVPGERENRGARAGPRAGSRG